MHAPVALALFAKTPGLTPAKTRLAASIGTPQAEILYQRMLNYLLNTLAGTKNMGIELIIAAAEKEAAHHPQWQGYPVLWTGEGGLGTRLHRIYAHLQPHYQAVLLMGADTPHITLEILAQAAEHAHTQPVLGPTHDGGFYLFGHHQSLPQAMWESVPYSCTETATSLCAALPPSAPMHDLPLRTDIDVEADLACLQAEAPDVWAALL